MGQSLPRPLGMISCSILDSPGPGIEFPMQLQSSWRCLLPVGVQLMRTDRRPTWKEGKFKRHVLSTKLVAHMTSLPTNIGRQQHAMRRMNDYFHFPFAESPFTAWVAEIGSLAHPSFALYFAVLRHKRMTTRVQACSRVSWPSFPSSASH